jgi:hypothetical protein
MQQQSQQTQQLDQTLNQLVDKVNTYEQQMVQQKVDTDVGKAVERINSKLNVDSDLAEAMLDIEYRKNPAFQTIWNNRDSNPQAYDQALDILADKLMGKVAVRADEQLAENVRAAKTSQQTLSKTQPEDPYEKVGSMNEADFQRWWKEQKGS